MVDIFNEWDRVWSHGSHNHLGIQSVETWDPPSLKGADCGAMGYIIVKWDRVWIHGIHHR